MEFKDEIEKFKSIITESNNIVFFGGAGVSTASGIPDFRSKDGLYNQKDIQFEKYAPEYLLDRKCLKNNPKVFYEFYRQKLDTRNIEPNITHYKLADLEKIGKLKAIVTQNIDGLHQKAGSKNVIELHGTTAVSRCRRCNKEFNEEYIKNTTGVPRCECGGIIRPDVVLYGEQLPSNAIFDATEAIKSADTLIIAGTSLSVFPAAYLIYEFRGKNMVVINEEQLESVKFADLMIIGNIKEVFEQLEV